jgi:C-terminal processing protease CtpA/Prc
LGLSIVVVSTVFHQPGRTLAAVFFAATILCGVQIPTRCPVPDQRVAGPVACPSRTCKEVSGIGVLVAPDINQGGRFTVLELIPGAPAEKAGLLSGDVIEQINGRESGRMRAEVAASQLRGEPGTRVEIKVFRPSNQQRFLVQITRAKFIGPSLQTQP